MNHIYSILSFIVVILYVGITPVKAYTNCSSMHSALLAKAAPDNSITVTSDATSICEGESTTITLATSETGVSYQLIGNGTNIGSAISGTGNEIKFSVSPNANTTYEVHTTNISSGESATLNETVTITVAPGPNLDLNVVSNENSICEGLNIPVTISVENSENGLSYWLKDDKNNVIGSSTGNGSTMNFSTVSPTSTTLYSVETTMAGCHDRLELNKNVQVDVNPLPEKTINLSISEPKICVGEKTIISLDKTETGVNYQLFDGTFNEGDPIAGTGEALSFPEFSPFRSKTYQVIATNVACGTSVTQNETIKVTVGLQPEIHLHPTIDKHTICEGEEVIVSLTPSDPLVTYQLFDGDNKIGTPLSGNSVEIDFTPTSPDVSTTYRIEAMGKNCVNPIDIKYTVDVTVHHTPMQNKELIANRDTICKGEEVVFKLDNSQQNVFYQLHDGNNFIEPNVIGNGGMIEFPVQTLNNTTIYQVYAHEAICTDQVPMNKSKKVSVLNFDPLPIETFATPEEFCDGEKIDIELPASINGVEYVLYDGNNEIDRKIGDGNSLVFEDISPNNNSIIEIAVANCQDELRVAKPNYTLQSNPEVQIITKDVQSGYDGDLVIAVSGGTAPFTYIVDPGETITTDKSVLELTKQETGTYQVLVVDANACRSSDAGQLAEINVDEDVQVVVNNALTPNGDGFNDEWKIHFNSSLGNPEVYVYNIYGQQVYHSSSYQNNWKGTNNGKKLPNGAYYYLVEFDNEDIKPIKGSLSILGN